MINLTTIIMILNNIRNKLKGALTKNPNSDLAVSLVKLNGVILSLKSVQKELEQNTTSKQIDAIKLIVRMSKSDIAFTEEEAIKFFYEQTK